MKIFDISLPINPRMAVWPGDPPVELQQLSAIAHGANANVSQIEMSVHTGTHIDAPNHFIDSGKTIDELPLEKLIGQVLVMEIDHKVDIITESVLEKHPDRDLLKTAKKVLFKTRNSSLWKVHPTEFQSDYVGINKSGASYLAKMTLDLIGMDYLSVTPFTDTVEPHQILLAKGIIMLEGIDLSGVSGGLYQLYCLPLNIEGCDGAPARAILIQ